MGFPNKATQFKPGQSGNPTGKRRRPDIDALNDLIAEKGLDKAIALTIVTQALGDKKNGVPPNFAYMKLLIEYRNGGAPKGQDDEPDVNGDADAKPRIVIPGSPGNEGRPAAKASPRKRKPPA